VQVSIPANVNLTSQSFALTERSITVVVQPPTFTSQSLTLAENAVTLQTAQNIQAASQSLSTTLNSVGISITANPAVTKQTITTTLHSVALTTDANLSIVNFTLTITENGVTLKTDQVVVAPSQTIYTTLNGLRLWQNIATAQPGSCTDGIDGTWTPLPFDTLVYGDDAAIATMPIGSLPKALTPIRKFPGSSWTNVPDTTTTNWNNIPT
jgi:hypothetical protein